MGSIGKTGLLIFTWFLSPLYALVLWLVHTVANMQITITAGGGGGGGGGGSREPKAGRGRRGKAPADIKAPEGLEPECGECGGRCDPEGCEAVTSDVVTSEDSEGEKS